MDHLARNGPTSRQDLIKQVGLSRTTLLALVTDLVERKALIEQRIDQLPSRRGRPVHEIAINPQGGLWLAVELAHTDVRVAFANAAHVVIGRGEDPISRAASRTKKVQAVMRLVDNVCTGHGITVGPLRGITLAVVGLEQASGSNGRPSDVREDSLAVSRQLERHFAAPVIIENNTRLAAYGEAAFGAAKGLPNVLYVRLADGISCGVIADGRILTGANGLAGEIGHVSVDRRGPQCFCGRRGCLELYLGTPGLLAAANDAGAQVRTRRDFFTAAATDRRIQKILRTSVRHLASVLVPAVTLLDPDAVVVGGWLSRLEGLVLDPLREQLTVTALPSTSRPTEVVASSLNFYAATTGGLALMLNSRFNPAGLTSRSQTAPSLDTTQVSGDLPNAEGVTSSART